jgi:Na+-driven multidrug efflux pump
MADYLIEIPLLEPTISSNSLNFQAETDDFEDFQHTRLALIKYFLSIFRDILKTFIPMGLSFSFSMQVAISIALIDKQNASQTNLAAATDIANYTNALAVVGFSGMYAISIYANKLLGQLKDINDDELAETINDLISTLNRNGLLVGLLPMLLTMLAFWDSGNILKNWFGQAAEVAADAQNYLRRYALAFPGMLIRMAFEQFIFSYKHLWFAAGAGLSSLAICTGLATVLGFGLFNIPEFGNAGIALAYGADAYIVAALFGARIVWHRDFRQVKFFLNMFKRVPGSGRQLVAVMKDAALMTFGMAFDVAMPLVAGLLSGIIGIPEQAAFNAITQLYYIMLIPVVALAQTGSQQISRALGEKLYRHARNIGICELIINSIFVIPLPLICAVYPEIFTLTLGANSADILPILVKLSPIMMFCIVTDSFRINLLAQLRAAGDNAFPTIFSSVTLTAGMLSEVFAVLKMNTGIDGVGACYAISEIVATSGLGIRSWLTWSRLTQPHLPGLSRQREDGNSRKLAAPVTQCSSTFFKSCCQRANFLELCAQANPAAMII